LLRRPAKPAGLRGRLIGEHRTSGEKKYYLANLPAITDLRTLLLAATIKARWICEQAHQQMKQELGLDHFEGRSWHGLHDDDRLRLPPTSPNAQIAAPGPAASFVQKMLFTFKKVLFRSKNASCN
jgi:hypothetical protein